MLFINHSVDVIAYCDVQFAKAHELAEKEIAT
jgi:hypothetical protein